MDEPIRVLHVIGIMNRGGAETMIMNLYRNIDRSKVQFDFVENEGNEAAFDAEIYALGGRIFHCPRYTGKNHFSYVKWWNNFFAKHANEYRIVHGHIGSTAAIYLSVAKKYGLFTIAHSHNARTQLNLKEIIYAAYAYPVRFIADQCFACSRAAGVSRYGQKIGNDSERCIVFHNAIDTRQFRFDPSERNAMRTRLRVNDRIVIGHVGRFDRQKNHSFLLRIFQNIVLKAPNAVLLLVGDGTLRENIETYISDHGLSENVILTGIQSNVAPYYQAMDIFVFPSLSEGLPVTLVEAQASGLPCVISDHVPRESIITDGLVTVQNLDDSAGTWAKHILARIGTARTDHSAEVAAHGYDISETAKWLEEFYVRKYEEQTRY